MAEDLAIQIKAEDLTGQAFANVQKQLGDIAAASQASAKQMADLGDMAGKLAQKGADLAGFGGNVVGLLRGGAIVGAIGLALNELHKFNDEIVQSIAKTVEQAAALGMTSERLQIYAYALAKAGLAQGEVASTLDRQRQLQKTAMAGDAAAIESYQNLGVKILDANGKLRDYGTITAEVARAILAMTDAEKQAAAAKDMLGLSGLRAVPALKELARGADEVERSARAAHAVLDEKLAKAVADSTVKSQQLGIAVKGLYAEFGMPIYLVGLDILRVKLAEIEWWLRAGKTAGKEFYDMLSGGVSVAIADVKAVGAGEDAQAARAEIATLTANIAALEKKIADGADPGPTRRLMDPNGGAEYRARLERQLADLQSRRETLESKFPFLESRASIAGADAKRTRDIVVMRRGQGDINESDRNRLLYDGLPSQDEPTDPKKKPPPATGGAGGGDRIETAINRLQGEKAAAEEALARMIAGSDLPLKELERQVDLDKKIADEVARLGATKPGDPRVAEIAQLVTAKEKATAATKQFTEASREAEQTEKSLGDGTLYLRTEQQRLGEQVASGRLDWDTYGVALQQASEKSEDMRLKIIGQQGGFDGLVAGMQHAANQFERNNRVFQNGGRIFDGLMSTMDQALSDFVTKGEVNFGKLAGSFALMIAQMELKAAASAVWGAIGGFGGIAAFLGFGGGGANQGGFATEGSGSGGFMGPQVPGGEAVFTPNFSGNADGGDVMAGVPSWVGEAGKELFVPSVPGSILNHAQLRNMFADAGGGGGDGGVTIVQHMNFGSDVNRAELETRLARHKQETIGAVIDARRRGGPIKKAFG